MANNAQPVHLLRQTNISLWGPSGAGKDWLFRSFAKELDFYNRTNQDFSFELSERNPGEENFIPLSPEPPINMPTIIFEDIPYHFQRTPRIQDQKHAISSREHEIIIHNEAGGNLVDCLNDPQSFQETFQTLIDSENIFLVLGIPNKEQIPIDNKLTTNEVEINHISLGLEASSTRQSSGFPTQIQGHPIDVEWTIASYLKFLQLLFAAIEKTPGHNIAVCMTKSDQLNYRGDSWQILQRRYGLAIRRLLELKKLHHNIEVFVTSAVGYIRQGSRFIPNFQNNALLDPNRWNPVNTAAPFFWIFQNIERTSLPVKRPFEADPQNLYIPYPPPRTY